MFTYMKSDKKVSEKWKELLKGQSRPFGSGQLLHRSFSAPMLKTSNEEYNEQPDISDSMTDENSSSICQLENSSRASKNGVNSSKGSNQRRLRHSRSYPELNYTASHSLFVEVSLKTMADSDSSESAEEERGSPGLPQIEFIEVELTGGLSSIHNDATLVENDASIELFQSPKSSIVESETREKQLFSTPLPSCSAHNLPVISFSNCKTSKVSVNNGEQLNEPTAVNKTYYFENFPLTGSTSSIPEVCNKNQQKGEKEQCSSGTVSWNGTITLSDESGNSEGCNNSQQKTKQNQDQDKQSSSGTIPLSGGSTISCHLDCVLNPQQQNREESKYIKPSDKEGDVSPVQPVQEIQSCIPWQKADSSTSILIPPKVSKDPPGTYRPELLPRDRVLAFCEQQEPVSFDDGFDWESIICEKIGEGSFGNVYLLKAKGKKHIVIKVIPVAEESGSDTGKMSYEDVLPELVITKRLNELSKSHRNRTSNFVKLTACKMYSGFYPNKLMYSWNRYNDRCISGFNPSQYLEDQDYLILSFEHGGRPLGSCKIKNFNEALSIFAQTACALAVAETAYQFEHRDLHADNILISSTKRKKVQFIIDGCKLNVTTYGQFVTLIDFTLSRLTDDGGLLIFFDLGLEEGIFSQEGDYQFQIYRYMKENANGDWQAYKPYTNILWLHYMLKFLVSELGSQKDIQKNTYAEKKLTVLEKKILKLKNSKEVVEELQLNKKKASAKPSSRKKAHS